MRYYLLLFLALCLTVSSAAFAAMPTDISQSPSCRLCSMDRGKFNYSRILIQYEDGSAVGTCSLHCAALELANSIDKVPAQVSVADYDSKELIDAEKAVWVLGGSKKGVMTGHAKWAFGSSAAAERFIAANGGQRVTFDDAIKAAYEEMYQDTKMIRDFRKMKQNQHQHQHQHEHQHK